MGCVFVTVGTTRFEELVEVVDSDAVKAALVSRGYSELVVQYGKGEYQPCLTPYPGLKQSSYRYKPSLQEDFASADLVISHAGFGCLIESLGMGKAVLAVINTSLMDNHQVEIAAQLDRLGVRLLVLLSVLISNYFFLKHATMTQPNDLVMAISKTKFEDRVPLPKAVPEAYTAYIGKVLGV